jgi:UPF0176 protein
MTQEKIAIVSFYSFTNISEPEMLIPKILLVGKKKSVRGTILVAKEGFNGSISGTIETTNILLQEIIKITNAQDVNVKINYDGEHPFHKLKVKLKPEIIAMGIGEMDIENLKGDYIETKDWDNFIARGDVIVVDTRNDYEVEVGTFEGAIDPLTETFKQFPKWVEANRSLLEGKKVAMFCTGGVRCEKSTAYLKTQGFEDVYHLKGGILQYLEDTGNKAGKWKGECFVFDDRGAVDEELRPAL